MSECHYYAVCAYYWSLGGLGWGERARKIAVRDDTDSTTMTFTATTTLREKYHGVPERIMMSSASTVSAVANDMMRSTFQMGSYQYDRGFIDATVP
jgi:hypothetical protein